MIKKTFFIIMIAESCYVLVEEHRSLYQTQISYHDEFVFEEEDPSSYPESYIVVQYDIPNNPVHHQLVPHKRKVYLQKINQPELLDFLLKNLFTM